MPKKKTTSSAIASAPFEGFPKSTFAFLRELAKNNDRDWFANNKHRYESEVLGPSLAFIAALQPAMRKISPYILVLPKRMGGSLMRVYRDTRFSKNKSPYKIHIGIHLRHELGGDIHAPGYYVHIEPGNSFVGAGIWMPETEPLTRIRELIVEDSRYWKKVRDDKKFASQFKLEGESLKTVPRGFEAEHPMIDDLRRKSFIGVAPINDKTLINPSCVEVIATAFREAKPLMKFLCDALDQPF